MHGLVHGTMAVKPAKRKRAKGKPRRARGTGSIFFHEKRQTWVGRKVVGAKIVERWGKTQGEVVKKLSSIGTPSATISVEAWAARWLETLTIRPATRASYNDDLQRIYAAMGTLAVVAVKPSHIEGMIATLTKPAFAQNTIANTVSTARHLFNAAVKEELIVRNPATLAKKPRVEKKAIDPFTPDELKRIIDSWQDFTTGALVATLASTGCRVGEACALDVASAGLRHRVHDRGGAAARITSREEPVLAAWSYLAGSSLIL